MTVIVGVRCSDGIVVGADSAATASAGPMPLLRMGADKIQLIGNSAILAGTGSVGLTQRFYKIVDTQWKAKLNATRDCVDCAKQLAKEGVEDFNRTHVPFSPERGYGYGALLAGVFSGKPDLIEFDVGTFQPEVKRDKLFFVSMGSGQTLADPFLAFIKRVMWRDVAPTVDEAKFGVYWALSHTLQCAPGFVGPPIKLAVLKKHGGDWRAELLEEPELQELGEYIDEVEEHISKYPRKDIADAEFEPPPKPPAKA